MSDAVNGGIKLLENVRNEILGYRVQHPGGFSEFQYAQKAVHYNAREFPAQL
jgi:YesN/AraC family two-component response regulator